MSELPPPPPPPTPAKSSVGVVSLAGERKIAKHDFDQQRKAVLAAIPENQKSLWGHVGFARTVLENEWVPCLFLGPYDVGPTSAMRQLYMEMFNKREDKENMPVLVHWYGSVDLKNASSLVPFKYVQVCLVRKRQVPLPAEIQNKMDYGQQLSWKDQCVYRAYWELNQDLRLDPTQRFRGEPFSELYEDDKYIVSVMAAKGRVAPDEIASQEEAIVKMETGEGNEGERVAKKARISNVYDEHQVGGVEGEKDGSITGGTKESADSNTAAATTGGDAMDVDDNKTPLVSQEEAKAKASTVKETKVHDISGTTPWPTGYTAKTTMNLAAGKDNGANETNKESETQARTVSATTLGTKAPPGTTQTKTNGFGKTMSADYFTAVMKPIKECQAQILYILKDELRNNEETIQETTFWRRQEKKWKQYLPFYDEGGSGSNTDAVMKHVERFMEAMSVITECQSQIKVLEKDMSRTRVEIANETRLWRNQENEWRAKLPFYDSCAV